MAQILVRLQGNSVTYTRNGQKQSSFISGATEDLTGKYASKPISTLKDAITRMQEANKAKKLADVKVDEVQIHVKCAEEQVNDIREALKPLLYDINQTAMKNGERSIHRLKGSSTAAERFSEVSLVSA